MAAGNTGEGSCLSLSHMPVQCDGNGHSHGDDDCPPPLLQSSSESSTPPPPPPPPRPPPPPPPPPPLPPPPRTVWCKHFMRGRCYFGAACRFPHPPEDAAAAAAAATQPAAAADGAVTSAVADLPHPPPPQSLPPPPPAAALASVCTRELRWALWVALRDGEGGVQGGEEEGEEAPQPCPFGSACRYHHLQEDSVSASPPVSVSSSSSSTPPPPSPVREEHPALAGLVDGVRGVLCAEQLRAEWSARSGQERQEAGCFNPHLELVVCCCCLIIVLCFEI